MIYSIATLFILISGWFWVSRYGLKIMAEKKAIKGLEKILFISESKQKKHVLQLIHQITNQRITDDQALDYFLKIKGLQTINFNGPIDYWVKKYLLSSTKVKLNYFEQVKFYETFLNFPVSQLRVIRKTDKSPLSNFPLTEAAQELIRQSIQLKKQQA